VKTGCNLTESSKEDYGSKRAVLPMMKMMMMIPTSVARVISYPEADSKGF
jgi:hypothetical protein